MPSPTSCSIVEGRRPAGLVIPEAPPGASALGDYFGRAAYLDAASALAFAQVGRDLESHGAPQVLVDGCNRARLAELRHARTLGRLAELHGVRPMVPNTQLLVQPRPLVDVAIENIVEGFVRQTYGATVARFRSRHARDPSLRRVMEEIADDEGEHAELALDIAMWLQATIDPIEGVWVENWLRHTVVSLVRDVDAEVDDELRERAGVPGRHDALAIWSGLSRRVWHGISERVWNAAA